MDLVGFDMTRRAAKAAYKESGVGPNDVSVCELHDCFSANELILLEGLGFCEKGKAHEMVRRGDITYGGKGPIINPSGGESRTRELPPDIESLLTGRHKVSFRRATHWVPPASLNVPSSAGSFAAGQIIVWSMRTLLSSITLASAAL